jgi:hypothetical protein
MLKFPSAASRTIALFAVTLALLGAGSLQAANLSVFKGTTGGKYTGIYLVSQAPSARVIGTANPVFTGNGKSGKFVIKGTVGTTGYQQTIVLRPNGKATVNPLFPGASGDFQITMTGSYKFSGRHVTITGVVNTTNLKADVRMDITYGTYNSALMITTRISPKNGSAPIYVTVTAA